MFLLGLLNIGSTTAFNAMVSLTVVGQYTSYLLSIYFLIVRKYSRKDVPLGPFQLKQPWGLLVNGFSIAFSIVVIVFSILPPYQPVTPENMNYASLVFGAVILLSVTSWCVYGRRIYRGPVRDVVENANVRRNVE